MKGELLIWRPDGTSEIRELTAEPELETLRKIVGGYLEAIPYFRTIEIGGSVVACLAFCNEEGKLNEPPLPINRGATVAWHNAMQRAGTPHFDDYLVGSIAIVTGDEILRAMFTDADEQEG